MHDKNFLQYLNLSEGSMVVFAKWTRQGVNFVCRLKDNARYEVQEVLHEKRLEKGEHAVYKVEHIHVQYIEKVETGTEGRRTYPRRLKSRNKSPTAAQLSLF
jgi:hypothetical protein